MGGSFELTIDGETLELEAGSVVIIPPNAVHSGRARTGCYVMDVFYPVREDYR
jgi:quercetin dioxygenase-like cupin family protein